MSINYLPRRTKHVCSLNVFKVYVHGAFQHALFMLTDITKYCRCKSRLIKAAIKQDIHLSMNNDASRLYTTSGCNLLVTLHQSH